MTETDAFIGRLAVIEDYLQRRACRPENRTHPEREAERGLKAMGLAPSLTLCRALLRGEAVPKSQLDRAGIRRYELRGEP